MKESKERKKRRKKEKMSGIGEGESDVGKD
jgi:hypothetical protein